MKIDRAGYPFIAAALAPAVGLAAARKYWWAAPFALAGGFFAYFFRDPDRQVPQGPGLVVSPADGKVMISGPSDGRWSPPGDWKQITIFLSPMDVHMNRSPVDGRVRRIEYRPGRFLPAYNQASNDNELNEIWIDHDGHTVVVRQVVGILARRIVCRIKMDDVVKAGDRFGVMKFGSRMDIFLPATATILVKPDDKVLAGITVIARLAGFDDPAHRDPATAP
jgi:phosphatidylserine decarboxylase